MGPVQHHSPNSRACRQGSAVPGPWEIGFPQRVASCSPLGLGYCWRLQPRAALGAVLDVPNSVGGAALVLEAACEMIELDKKLIMYC